MVVEKLVKQKNFTDVEKSIANYLLKNGGEAYSLSISELARVTYTSPATVTRLCKKIGVDGYKKFQLTFQSEYAKYTSQENINANYPFTYRDSIKDISRKLAQLNIDTINKTVEELDYDQLHRIVKKIREADMINIFGVGSSVNVALDFQQKMLRFGKIVNLTQNSIFMPGYAMLSTNKSVNLFISLSGETREIIECLHLLKQNNNYCVAITSRQESTCARMCNEVIAMELDEEQSYESKIDTFVAYNAFHLILDCIYSYLFALDYSANASHTKKNAQAINKVKAINN